ncbi:hypothetical protein KIW84_071624 [Lathyrus oleraceus]|uniref:Uncharacterized protein n=1 Tax=Pisum sativum TaxID=3888 RepID=A0A9D4ZTC9_PEA|nr:hypothetical protein KIW84_071624 [Pisum sativum]
MYVTFLFKFLRNVKYEEALEKFESVLGTKLEPNEAAVAGFELPRCKQCSHIHNCHGATTTTSSCTDFKPVPAGNPTGFGNFANPAGYAMLAPGVVGGASSLEDSSRVKYKDNLYVPNLQIALGGATGICYLHHECSPPVIHSSILFDEDCEAKIVTHGYIAPELDEAAVASYNVTCCHSKLNQAPTATNYDVGSTTWVDLRIAPLLSAMEVTLLGHGPSRSTIDPIQTSDQSRFLGYEKAYILAEYDSVTLIFAVVFHFLPIVDE